MQVNFANANSGIMAASIGWFDFTGVNLAINTSIILSNSLPRGGNITFRLASQNINGNLSFTGITAPQRPGIPFGEAGYTGIAGRPLLYATQLSGGEVNITIDNITVTNNLGVTVPFGLVVAEGEGSIGGEFWRWNTDGTPWKLVSNLFGSLANINGIGTSTVTWGGANPWPSPVLSTNNPTRISGYDIEFSQSAIALGVILTPIEIQKNIGHRKYSNDQFNLSITGPQVATTVTYGNTLGPQVAYASVLAGEDEVYVLNEAMGSGSTGVLGEYTQTISIVNLSVGGTTIPTNWKLGDPLSVKMGDNIKLIITNDTHPDIRMVKTVSQSIGTIGDILTYTIALSNITSNTVVDLNFIDTIPSGSALVPDSLFVNGVLNNGDMNPPTGLTGLSIDKNGKTTITYRVRVDSGITTNTLVNSGTTKYSYTINGATIPIQNANSNIVSTSIVYATVIGVKDLDRRYARLGDILTYTIVLTNIGNTNATNVLFKDTIPIGTSLLPNSVYLNGNNILGANLQSGISIGNMGANGKSTITFKVNVVSVPNNNVIENIGASNYSYLVGSTVIQNTKATNIVTTTVANVDFSGILKSVDKNFAKPGDILTYTINIPNTGNVKGSNLIFRDTIPEGTTLVSNSTFINGVPTVENIGTGLNIGTINPGEVLTIMFSVKIN